VAPSLSDLDYPDGAAFRASSAYYRDCDLRFDPDILDSAAGRDIDLALDLALEVRLASGFSVIEPFANLRPWSIRPEADVDVIFSWYAPDLVPFLAIPHYYSLELHVASLRRFTFLDSFHHL
jgi:hypothetical protein